MNYEEALALVPTPVKNGWTKEENRVVHYVDGKIYREDGPAIISSDGTQFYYQNDQLHRLDGPALILQNGHQYYYQNDQLHRNDGPAVIYPNGDKEYWIDGKQLTEAEFDSRFAGNN